MMKIDLTSPDKELTKDLLYLLVEHLAFNTGADKVVCKRARDGDEVHCDCVWLISLEAEFRKGIFATFGGCGGELRVLASPPPKESAP